MYESINALDNFCTTLPAYIIHMLSKKADSLDKTISETLQNILEEYFKIDGWRDKWIDKSAAKLRHQFLFEANRENLISTVNKKDAICQQILINLEYPYKMEMGIELSRVDYKVYFSIFTSSKKSRKDFKHFYSSFQDILQNREFRLEEYARFASIAYKKKITYDNISLLIDSDVVIERVVDDLVFLRNIMRRYSWKKVV